jgi:enoyl-CoA hydratase/carnithine racemase
MKLSEEYLESRKQPSSVSPTTMCVKPMPLDEYAQLYADYFKFKREDGILECRMHSNNGRVSWTDGHHKAAGHIARYIGDDTENEVVILTGTDDMFIGPLDPDSLKVMMDDVKNDPAKRVRLNFDIWLDGRGDVENWVQDIHVPTIGVLNGTTVGLSSLCTYCDLTLCADDVYFYEPHFFTNVVPGDGQFMMFQYYLGPKRANAMEYLGKQISAQEALDLGLVNEVLPRDQLLPRAWEIARDIMKRPRHVRRMTHELMRKPLLEYIQKDQTFHSSLQMWGESLSNLEDAGKTSKGAEAWEDLAETMKANEDKYKYEK